VVVDESLLETVDVTKGLKKDGAILVNTERTKEDIIPQLKGYEGKVYIIDAKKVSLATMGKYFPNTPLLAAIVKVAGIMEEETFLREMEASFKHKFASKPEVIAGNMAALKMAMQEVQ
jgi:pyruvate ferredoxin oxidoreductase gamma subunit